MIGKKLISIIDPALEVLVLYADKHGFRCVVYACGRYLSISIMDEDLLTEQFRKI